MDDPEKGNESRKGKKRALSEDEEETTTALALKNDGSDYEDGGSDHEGATKDLPPINHASSKRKRKPATGSALNFVDMEADEDDSSDEDYDFRKDQNLGSMKMQDMYALNNNQKSGVGHYASRLAEIEERLGKKSHNEEELDEEDDLDNEFASYADGRDAGVEDLSRLLPREGDPNLWVVKMFRGKPADAVLALAAYTARQKYMGKRVPLISVFVATSSNDKLYIEADNIKDVTQALTGLGNIDRRSFMIVPHNERAQVFMMSGRTQEMPEVGAKVKMLKGLYMGDTMTVVQVSINKWFMIVSKYC